MNRVLSYFVLFLTMATPALAFETEEIGTLAANFGGEAITQPTVKVIDGDNVDSTATLHLLGPFTALSISGFRPDNAILSIGVSFLSETPSAGTSPVGVEISYWPTGGVEHWTAYEAPGLDNINFTTLTLEGDKGHVTGTFNATLCHMADYEEEADMDNCRPIEGSFDTLIAIQR